MLPFYKKEEMKTSKILLFIFLICLILGSCSKPKIKTVRGYVTSVEINGDTLKTIHVTSSEGNFIFNMKDARFNEGIMMKADSVLVDYIEGRHDTARALVITVLPKSAHYIETNKVDTTNALLTLPVQKDSIKK
jgi:hypothetical protein